MKENRIVFVDYLRVVACFLVMLVPPRWITSLSKLSFGMYLMHLFFLSNIATVLVAGDQANPLVPVWLAIPCIAILTFLCCAITTKLISYVPGSKWIIG